MQYLGYKSEPQKVSSTVEKVRKKSQNAGYQAAQTLELTLYSKIVYLHRLPPKRLFFLQTVYASDGMPWCYCGGRRTLYSSLQKSASPREYSEHKM